MSVSLKTMQNYYFLLTFQAPSFTFFDLAEPFFYALPLICDAELSIGENLC